MDEIFILLSLFCNGIKNMNNLSWNTLNQYFYLSSVIFVYS